jgi:hypothetical protein
MQEHRELSPVIPIYNRPNLLFGEHELYLRSVKFGGHSKHTVSLGMSTRLNSLWCHSHYTFITTGCYIRASFIDKKQPIFYGIANFTITASSLACLVT